MLVGTTPSRSYSFSPTFVSSHYSHYNSYANWIDNKNYLGRWNHVEARAKVPFSKTTPSSFGWYETGGKPNTSKIDNVLITSTHGPTTINKDPYTFTHPGVEILSVDYDGYSNAAADRE